MIAACFNDPYGVCHTWERDTTYGKVTVKQVRGPDGLCIERQVELRREVGLYVDGRPDYVRAIDHGCDDVFDEWRFRTYLRQRDVQDLSDLLLFLMYQTMPISEHPKWQR